MNQLSPELELAVASLLSDRLMDVPISRASGPARLHLDNLLRAAFAHPVFPEWPTPVDGWLDEQLMATAFDVHPYRWPTIGWMADIRAVGLDDIRRFYRTWYAPNNATLVVVGDFDEAQLLSLIHI